MKTKDPKDLARRRREYRERKIEEHKNHLLSIGAGWTEKDALFSARSTYSAAFVRSLIPR